MSAALQTEPRLYTEHDLWKLSHEGRRCELIEGRLREMSPSGGEHGRLIKRFDQHLTGFIYDRDLGECFAAETGFTVGTDPDTTMAPDWAFVRWEKLPPPPLEGYVHAVPDLVLEVRSPGDRRAQVEDKVQRWLAAGVRAVLDLDPRARKLTIHRAEETPTELAADDELSLPELPGFRLPLRALFRGRVR